MLSDKEYIRSSLETNLFFLRIAKEHTVLAAASLTPRDRNTAGRLIALNGSFERLLFETIRLADRNISHEVLASDELVTDFTLAAEIRTAFLTGIPINTGLTRRELELRGEKSGGKPELCDEVKALNSKAAALTKAAMEFKRRLLKNISECRAFSYTYPTMLEHLIEEERYYTALLEKLNRRDALDTVKEIIEEEINWNHIMEEHSEFIRGYLDPKEEKLLNNAESFARRFEQLTEKSRQTADNPSMLHETTRESLKNVTLLRNFKAQGTQGLLACKIKALMSPLLADHVTREANRFIRLLEAFEKMV